MKRISESDLRIRAQEAFPGCMDDVLEQLVTIGLRGYEQGRAGWYKDGDFSSDADFCYGVGARIREVEEALETVDDAVSAFYQRAHSEGLAAHTETCLDRACCPREDEEACPNRTVDPALDCLTCGKRIGPNRHHNERQCRRVQIRKEARAKGRVLPIYVVVLGISRHYGGPEEGGWYYDWRTIHEVRKVWSFRSAREAIRELREEYPKPRHSRFSVLGGEDMFIHVCLDEQEFPRESTEVPRYE